MKISIFTLIFSMLFQWISAQERLSGLVVNPGVKNSHFNQQKLKSTQQVMTLPFFDDFSDTDGFFPKESHWTDNYVFINNDYSVNPPTVGVATFDAIDNFGGIYGQASPFPFGADTLTSVEIRLDTIFTTTTPRKINISDSLYFSFYYQPQGLGNTPAAGDSLVLEFLSPDEGRIVIIPADTVVTGTDTLYYPADTIVYETWITVWSSSGQTLSSFYNIGNKWFQQVLIHVKDSARFYKPDFRFRFRNYASLADATLPDWQSNGDQWNVDYIYLNIDRSANDQTHPDVAFASKAPNMLSRYTSMPYDQYRKQFVTEMAKNINLNITNLGAISYNASYRYEVTDKANRLIHTYSGGNYFVPPYATNGYVTEPKFANPPVDFQYPINETEPVFFTITHILNTEANLGRRSNDTIQYRQIFSNYLAYDDGTAEAGYGITPSGAEVAYRFKINQNDSLYGVNMFFNQTLSQGNIHSFYLNVWNDYFGEPGDLVYSRFGYQPVIEDSLNKFFYYELDSAIFLEPGRFPGLTFYVGWTQVNDNVLNMGYDKNNNASSNILFRTTNAWNTSLYNGALMIRPVIGQENPLSLPEKSTINEFTIYPNPARGSKVKIKTKFSTSINSNYSVFISTADGRVIYESPLSDEMDINNLPNGLYFIQLRNNNLNLGVEKLIINR